jgi:hypothetical protein
MKVIREALPPQTSSSSASAAANANAGLDGEVGSDPAAILSAPGPPSLASLEALERTGEILIMRALTGQEFKDVPLPKLGRQNVNGLKITEGRSDRWRVVWWDDVKERGRAGKRLDDGECGCRVAVWMRAFRLGVSEVSVGFHSRVPSLPDRTI